MDLSKNTNPKNLYSPNDETSSQFGFPIECRPSPLLWIIVLLGFGMAVFMFTGAPVSLQLNPKPQDDNDLLITRIMGVLYGCMMLYLALELVIGFIRADEKGLTWRSAFTRPKSVRWEEITDYYRGQSKYQQVITPAGKLTLHTHFRNVQRVADLVIENTPHIDRAGWEMKGTRSNEKWSRSFAQWSNATKWTAPIISLLPLLIVICVIAEVRTNAPTRNQPSLGFWMDTFPLIMSFGFFGLLSFACIWMLRDMWRIRLYASKHRDEKLVFTAEGLKYTNRDQHFEAKWSEIKSLTFLPEIEGITPVKLETASTTVTVWHIADKQNWLEIFSIFDQYVPHATKPLTGQLLGAESDLEGERGAWSGGTTGVPTRRWSYHSREVRFALRVTSFGLFCLPLLYPLSLFISQEEQSIPLSWGLFGGLYVASFLAVAALWIWYSRTEILADERGIEIRSPFHRGQRASWQEIETLGTDGMGHFIRAGEKKLYFVRIFSPVRVDELRTHIEEQVKNVARDKSTNL